MTAAASQSAVRLTLLMCAAETLSMTGFACFTTAFLAPLVFGVVLDIAGGNQSRIAWGLAFASIGIFGVLAPVARWIYVRRAA